MVTLCIFVKYNFENVNAMMIGSGFMMNTVDNMKKLPSKKSKFKSGGKFMKDLQPQKTHKHNGGKLEVKEISKSELEEVLSSIRLDEQKERRKLRLRLPLYTLIAIFIFIVTLVAIKQFLLWYFPSG